MKSEVVVTDVSLADAELESYKKSDSSLALCISAWDDSKIDLLFEDVIRFLDNDANGFAGLYAISGHTRFLEDSLKRLYESNIPEDHPYKHYRLLDVDDIPAIEIVSSSLSVSYR